MMYITVKQGENPVEVLLNEVKASYLTQYNDLLRKVDDNVSKPLLIKDFPKKTGYIISGDVTLSSSCTDMFKNKSYYGGWRDITSSDALAKRLEKIKEQAQLYINDCQVVFNENIEAVEHNKKVVAKVTSLMKAIGIPDTYYESYFKTNRSSKKTTDTKRAGYLQDIDRNIKLHNPAVPLMKDIIGDSYTGVVRVYEDLIKKLREAEVKAEKEKQLKESEHKVALLRAKYTPDDAMSEGDEILEGVLSKCKYLRLAYYLEKNRGDWNDGYDYAETGISGFIVETEEDREISQEINSLIDNGQEYGDIDGRVFRDCEYNYGYLFTKVDESLMKDYNAVRAFIGDED